MAITPGIAPLAAPGGKNQSLRRKQLMPLTLREFDNDQTVCAMHKTVAVTQGRAKYRRRRAAWQSVPATLARSKVWTFLNIYVIHNPGSACCYGARDQYVRERTHENGQEGDEGAQELFTGFQKLLARSVK